MNTDTLIDDLNQRISLYGTQKATAEVLGVSAQYLGDVLTNKRAPGKKLLKAMGYKRIITYVKASAK